MRKWLSMGHVFWATIFLLVALTLGLVGLAYLNAGKEAPQGCGSRGTTALPNAPPFTSER